MRALVARMQLCRKREQLTPDEEFAVQSPLRKFKSMFPSTPLTKHTPLDILVTAPESGHPRSLIVRDLGSVQNDWLAREFVLGYFEGNGISPPVSTHASSRYVYSSVAAAEAECDRETAELRPMNVSWLFGVLQA